MHGQLWEPCPRCDTEPVCVDCGYCERHCHCGARQRDAQEIAQMNRRYPGLLERVERHYEDGGKEH